MLNANTYNEYLLLMEISELKSQIKKLRKKNRKLKKEKKHGRNQDKNRRYCQDCFRLKKHCFRPETGGDQILPGKKTQASDDDKDHDNQIDKCIAAKCG